MQLEYGGEGKQEGGNNSIRGSDDRSWMYVLVDELDDDHMGSVTGGNICDWSEAECTHASLTYSAT